jgi:hypothetical protein
MYVYTYLCMSIHIYVLCVFMKFRNIMHATHVNSSCSEPKKMKYRGHDRQQGTASDTRPQIDTARSRVRLSLSLSLSLFSLSSLSLSSRSLSLFRSLSLSFSCACVCLCVCICVCVCAARSFSPSLSPSPSVAVALSRSFTHPITRARLQRANSLHTLKKNMRVRNTFGCMPKP